MFLGRLVYCVILMVNAIAVLSEDRFLARSTSSQAQPTHPQQAQQANKLTQSDGVAHRATKDLARHMIIPALRRNR